MTAPLMEETSARRAPRDLPSIPGPGAEDVGWTHTLEALLLVPNLPAAVACDNGPEVVSPVLDQWATTRGSRTDCITPGRPVANCYIEGFNGKLQDECLNHHHFTRPADASTDLEARRQDCRTDRSHWGRACRTPAKYIAVFTPEEADS